MGVISIGGPDELRAARLKLCAARNSFNIKSEVTAMGLTVTGFNIHVGNTAPAAPAHCWCRDSYNRTFWQEVSQARLDLVTYSLDMVVIHYISNSTDLPLQHVVVSLDTVIRTFPSEDELQRYLMECASKYI